MRYKHLLIHCPREFFLLVLLSSDFMAGSFEVSSMCFPCFSRRLPARWQSSWKLRSKDCGKMRAPSQTTRARAEPIRWLRRARVRSLRVGRYGFGKNFTIHQWDDDGLVTCGVEFPDITYSAEEFYQNQKRLTRLKMEPLWTLLFQNPKMVVYNELENTELVYSSKYALNP
jgi:hypothetical protein